jgi:beta-N-acetylhexosaminidase
MNSFNLHKRRCSIIVGAMIMFISSCTHIKESDSGLSGAKNTFDNHFTVDASWRSLSVREKIGQTMIVVANYDFHKHSYGSVNAMMKQYPVGGIFLPSWQFIKHRPISDIIPNIRRTIKDYEDVSRYPLIITEDFESGMGDFYNEYTTMPALMSVGAANDKDLAWRFGDAISKEAKSIGVNWLLHPVADLNINPLGNLIVERSISDDANRAYPLIKSQLQAIHHNQIVSTIKHFPGDGTSMKNQHLVTSSNTMSIAAWNSTYGEVYQKLINDGVPCIMVGHIRFPSYQKIKTNDVLLPASLSEEVIMKLLKGKMKFNGVVMSDALNMGGVGGYHENMLETAIESFKAGVDIILWPNLDYMDEMEKRINSGEIPMARLDDAVKRIWDVRKKYGLIDKNSKSDTEFTDSIKSESKNSAELIAKSAITLIEDKYKEIPITPEKNKKIAIISISYNNISTKLKHTVKRLKDRGFEVDPIIHNPSFYMWQDRLSKFNEYDKVIVIFGNRNSSPMGESMLKGGEAMGLWTTSMIPFKKLIAISYGNPYYVNYYRDTTPIKINAYSYDEFSQNAAIDALTGLIPFRGTTPVNLDNPALM